MPFGLGTDFRLLGVSPWWDSLTEETGMKAGSHGSRQWHYVGQATAGDAQRM